MCNKIIIFFTKTSFLYKNILNLHSARRKTAQSVIRPRENHQYYNYCPMFWCAKINGCFSFPGCCCCWEWDGRAAGIRRMRRGTPAPGWRWTTSRGPPGTDRSGEWSRRTNIERRWRTPRRSSRSRRSCERLLQANTYYVCQKTVNCSVSKLDADTTQMLEKQKKFLTKCVLFGLHVFRFSFHMETMASRSEVRSARQCLQKSSKQLKMKNSISTSTWKMKSFFFKIF